MGNTVTIVCLAVVESGRMLLVRKRGLSAWILPGGKAESGEDDPATLDREIREEFGCRVDRSSLRYLGTFEDVSADNPEITVAVRLYGGDLIDVPQPLAELEEICWIAPGQSTACPLAPSIQNKIFPALFA